MGNSPTRRTKMRKKVRKNWGKLRKFDRNLRKVWGNWNVCPPGTVMLATALHLFMDYDWFTITGCLTHSELSVDCHYQYGSYQCKLPVPLQQSTNPHDPLNLPPKSVKVVVTYECFIKPLICIYIHDPIKIISVQKTTN